MNAVPYDIGKSAQLQGADTKVAPRYRWNPDHSPPSSHFSLIKLRTFINEHDTPALETRKYTSAVNIFPCVVGEIRSTLIKCMRCKLLNSMYALIVKG